MTSSRIGAAGARIAIAGVWLTAGLLGSLGCETTSGDSTPISPPPPPCAGVYDSAVNSCVAESGCAGFACFYVWEWCSADAKRGPLMDCCVANYATDEARQQCIDSLGSGP